MRAFLRDIIDHVIKDSIVIGCAFNQSGKVTICALDSILRPEYRYIQSCTEIIRPLARFYSYDYDLRKTNYIFK